MTLQHLANQLCRQSELHGRELFGLSSLYARLLKHQAGAALSVLTGFRTRALLADQVGLGKTIEALMILESRLLLMPHATAAILVPRHLLVQWQTEVTRLSPSVRSRVAVFSEQNMMKDIIASLHPNVEKVPSRPLSAASGYQLSSLLSLFQLCIVDELHLVSKGLREKIYDFFQQPIGKASKGVLCKDASVLFSFQSRAHCLVTNEENLGWRGAKLALDTEKIPFLKRLVFFESEIGDKPADFERYFGGGEQLILLTATPPLHSPGALTELNALYFPELYQKYRSLKVKSELELDSFQAYLSSQLKDTKLTQITKRHAIFIRAERSDHIDIQAADGIACIREREVRGTPNGHLDIGFKEEIDLDWAVQRLAAELYALPTFPREYVLKLLRGYFMSPQELKSALPMLRTRVQEATGGEVKHTIIEEIEQLLSKRELLDTRVELLYSSIAVTIRDSLSKYKTFPKFLITIGSELATKQLSAELLIRFGLLPQQVIILNGGEDQADLINDLWLQDGLAFVLLVGESGALVDNFIGLNLHCCTSLMMYYHPLDPQVIEQLIGRLDRVVDTEKQRGKVLIHNISLQNTMLRVLIDTYSQEHGVYHYSRFFNSAGETSVERGVLKAICGKRYQNQAEALSAMRVALDKLLMEPNQLFDLTAIRQHRQFMEQQVEQMMFHDASKPRSVSTRLRGLLGNSNKEAAVVIDGVSYQLDRERLSLESMDTVESPHLLQFGWEEHDDLLIISSIRRNVHVPAIDLKYMFPEGTKILLAQYADDISERLLNVAVAIDQNDVLSDRQLIQLLFQPFQLRVSCIQYPEDVPRELTQEEERVIWRIEGDQLKDIPKSTDHLAAWHDLQQALNDVGNRHFDKYASATKKKQLKRELECRIEWSKQLELNNREQRLLDVKHKLNSLRLPEQPQLLIQITIQ